MKKIIILIVSLAYFVSTSGATIYLHKCMGRVVSWDFHGEKDDTCDKCGMHKNTSGNCCKDDVKVLKISNDQLLQASVYNFMSLSDHVLPVSFFVLKAPDLTDLSFDHKDIFPPLRSSSAKFSALYCTFLI